MTFTHTGWDSILVALLLEIVSRRTLIKYDSLINVSFNIRNNNVQNCTYSGCVLKACTVVPSSNNYSNIKLHKHPVSQHNTSVTNKTPKTLCLTTATYNYELIFNNVNKIYTQHIVVNIYKLVQPIYVCSYWIHFNLTNAAYIGDK